MRLFVAVPISEELRGKLWDLGKEIDQDGIKRVNAANMHITLKFLGEMPEDAAEKVMGQLKEVEFSSFRCSVKGIGVFPNENYIRVVWAGSESNDQLEILAQKVQACLGGQKERFSSHITIARVKRKVDIKEFLEKHKDEEFGPLDVSEFHLMKSELKREGPEYSIIGTFGAKDA